MKIAVVGHTEWGSFSRIQRVPTAGEIIHAKEHWEEVAGGGVVAAIQIAALNGECTLFTAIGDDEIGKRSIEQLKQRGVTVHATIAKEPTKQLIAQIDDRHERTLVVTGSLTVSGEDQSLPWAELESMDAVYFVSGDKKALEYARTAKKLISTARILSLLEAANVKADVLVRSEADTNEMRDLSGLDPQPDIVVTTHGVLGGVLNNGETYQAEIVPLDEIVDFYGCGDSFAAGLTYGMAKTDDIHEALKIAAKAGADAARRRGVFGEF